MAGFSPSDRIDDPKFLFGRNKPGQLLEKVLVNILRGTNCQIQGEKRSGKTSTLICLKKKLESEQANSIVPIYINWKEQAWVKGTSNVYRFVLAQCIEAVSKAGILTEKTNLNGVYINPAKVWESAFGQLSHIEDFRVHGLLKEFVLFFSDLMSSGFVFLFDEFEHLFVYNLDRTEGFFAIRTLSEEPFRDKYKPLTYVIAGAKSWNKLGSQTGSLELNSMGAGILYLSPLERGDFREMWEYSLNKAGMNEHPILKHADTVNDLSGGVPFYAKVIGESVANQNEQIDYNLLLPHFEEVYKNLDGQELDVIKHKLNKKDGGNLVFHQLEKRGVIREVDKKYQINGLLLREFVKTKINTNATYLDPRQSEISETVKKIIRLITSINKTRQNKKRELIFKLTNEDSIMYAHLEVICTDAEDMIRFSSAMYKTVFERTKETKNLDLLPSEFQRSNKFVRIVDALRHHFGGHLTSDQSQKYSAEYKNVGKLLLDLISSQNDPTDDDYFKIQAEVLSRFAYYLTQIDGFVRK